jgi:hypothetical protein
VRRTPADEALVITGVAQGNCTAQHCGLGEARIRRNGNPKAARRRNAWCVSAVCAMHPRTKPNATQVARHVGLQWRGVHRPRGKATAQAHSRLDAVQWVAAPIARGRIADYCYKVTGRTCAQQGILECFGRVHHHWMPVLSARESEIQRTFFQVQVLRLFRWKGRQVRPHVGDQMLESELDFKKRA